MAYDLNTCILIGRLTRDPELRYTPGGDAICKFSIANNRGNRDEDVSFFNVVAWGKIAENVNKYLNKGSQVCVEGSLRQNRWEDSNTGQKRSTVEINAGRVHFLGGIKGGGSNNSDFSSSNNNSGTPQNQNQNQNQQMGNNNFSYNQDYDDTIPY